MAECSRLGAGCWRLRADTGNRLDVADRVVPLSGTSHFTATYVHLDDAADDAVGKRIRHLGDPAARTCCRHRLCKLVTCGRHLRRVNLRTGMELRSDPQGGATASGGHHANATRRRRTATLRGSTTIPPTREEHLRVIKKIALQSGGLSSLVFFFVLFCFFVGLGDRCLALLCTFLIALNLLFVDKTKPDWRTGIVVGFA